MEIWWFVHTLRTSYLPRHGPLEIFFFSKSCRVSKCSLFALVHSSYSILWKFFDFHAILATDKTNSLFSAYENSRTKLGVWWLKSIRLMRLSFLFLLFDYGLSVSNFPRSFELSWLLVFYFFSIPWHINAFGMKMPHQISVSSISKFLLKDKTCSF